jgi:hypothetical protein
MTEAEWLNGTDPEAMLDILRNTGKVSDRKLRLFAVGCCRKVWHHLKDARSEWTVEVLERWVDGQASHQELVDAHRSAWQAWGTPARTAVSDASAVECGLYQAAIAANHAAWAVSDGPRADERKAQAVLLRCVIGNPFHLVPTIEPSLLAWNDGIVKRLAEAAYEERQLPAGTLDQARLGVLADALEEAGCIDEELLGHLRGPGPHVRGCFVLDLLLNKEQRP